MNIDTYISSGVIESYVLGMADAREAAELLQLSRQYPEIKKAIEDFETSLEVAAFANAVPPPTALKQQLMFALKDEFSVLDNTNQTAEETKQNAIKEQPVKEGEKKIAIVKKIDWLKYAAAASIVLLVGSATLNLYFYSKYNEASNQVVALLNEKNNLTADNKNIQVKYTEILSSIQLMSDTNMIKVSLKGIAGKETNLATVFWDNKTKDVYLLANQLPQTPANKQYQLWGLVDGKPVNLGVIGNCNGVCKLTNINRAQAFAITLENKTTPEGNASPDLTQLQVIGKVQA